MNEFAIRIPRERPFSEVASFVVGGIASRHDLTLDALDDLRLALDSLLEREDSTDVEGDVNILLRVTEEDIETSVGPVGHRTVEELEHDTGDGLGLRRLLETLVDAVSVKEREGGRWVELHKRHALAGSEAGA